MRRELEDFLTLERLDQLHAYELVRLDPRRIDKELHWSLLNRLTNFGEFDALKEFFRAVGVEGVEGHFARAIDKAIADSKLDEATALLEIFDPPEKGEIIEYCSDSRMTSSRFWTSCIVKASSVRYES